MATDNNRIDEEKLKAAKEKLACKIEIPKSTGSSCSSGYIPVPGDKIRLTEMTTAGG